MPTWPASLPQTPLLDMAQITPEEVRAVFEGDVGPPIMRARTTSAGEESTLTFGMTSAQLATFQTFWRVDLSHGSASFTMDYTIDGTPQTFLFLSPYTIRQVIDSFFRVTVRLYMEPV